MYLILILLYLRIKILLKTKEDFLMINSKLAATQLKNIKAKKRLLILINIKKLQIFRQIKIQKPKEWFSVTIKDKV